MRKKITAIMLTGALAMMLAGCGGSERAADTSAATAALAGKTETEAKVVATTSQTEEENPICGGWTKPDSPVITDEIRNLVKKANEKLAGGMYDAVALLGTQVVAGMNYRLLCTVTATVPDAKPYYAIVTLYKDLQGNAEITDVIETTIEGPATEELDGGITAASSAELTADAKTAFDKATETLTGATFKPVALAATQVVAGINYFIFCDAYSATSGVQTGYAMLTVTAAADGSYSVANIEEIK